MSPAHI